VNQNNIVTFGMKCVIIHNKLILLSRVLLEKQIVSQLLKNPQPFTEPEISLPFSQYT